ncbi:MAG: pyridoxamine 5'-phosphate oxidase [Actinomycetota bacterium]
MITWEAFAETRPDLAEAGKGLLYQFGVGLAFLATTRADGAPRVHPMCPVLTNEGLYAFIVPSPKRNDLHRDGRYALHSFPADNNEDAFSLAGRADQVTDRALVEALAHRYAEEREIREPPAGLGTWEVFEFRIGSCLLTRTTKHGDEDPQHTTWHAPT